jgi:hypothetical protein
MSQGQLKERRGYLDLSFKGFPFARDRDRDRDRDVYVNMLLYSRCSWMPT